MPIKTTLKRAGGWLYLNSPKGRSQLRGAGVDMASPQPIHQALDTFDETIARMEELAE